MWLKLLWSSSRHIHGRLIAPCCEPTQLLENAVRWETPICIEVFGLPSSNLSYHSVEIALQHCTAKKKNSAFWEKQQLCVNSISRVGTISIIIIVLALGLFSQKRAGVSFLERLTAVSGYCSIFWVVYRQGGTAAAFISMPGQRCRFLCVRQSSKQLIVHWTVCAQGHVTG